MVFTLSGRKIGRKVSFNPKKSRCITVNSQFNIIDTDNFNTSNSDGVKGNSNLLCIYVHTKISF